MKRSITESYNKTEIEDKLNLKLNLSEFTEANQQRITVDTRLENSILDNKTELTNLINLKRSITDSYNKTEIEDKLNLKLNLSEINNYYNKTYINDTFDTKIQLNDKLNTKQNTIIDNALSISHINNLQNSLNAKQNTIIDNALSISHINNLQNSLNAKQNTITDNSLSISHINLLQSSLNAKQNTITNNSLSISHINLLQNSLDSKQPLLSDLAGNGVSILFENSLRKIFGSDGIDVTQFLNLGNENDPSNFQIRISGNAINTQLNSKLNSSEIQNYYTKLDTNNLLNAKQNSIGINGLEISNINNLQSSLDSKLSSSSFSNYFTKTELNDKILNYIYQYNNGLYNALYVKHNYGINFAISSNQNPLSSEILLSIETSSGVTINHSCHIENNLTIDGNLMVGAVNILNSITDLQNNSPNVDLSNYFTKTEINNKISNYIYQSTIAGFINTLFIKHINGINFYVNDNAILTLQDFNGALFYKNVQINETLTVGTTNILSSITNLQNNINNFYNKTDSDNRYYTKTQVDTNIANAAIDTTNFVSKTGNIINGDLITQGNIQGNDITASNELHVDGNAILNGILYLNGNNVRTELDSKLSASAASIITMSTTPLLRLYSSAAQGSSIEFGQNNTTRTFHIIQTGSNLEFWRSLYTTRSFVISNVGYVTFYAGYGSSSDQSIKSTPVDANIDTCINIVKNVSARHYTRLDMDSSTRIGFIAQEMRDALPLEYKNIINKTPYGIGDANDREILTLDYGRLTAILWQTTKSLLARVEILESRLNNSN